MGILSNLGPEPLRLQSDVPVHPVAFQPMYLVYFHILQAQSQYVPLNPNPEKLGYYSFHTINSLLQMESLNTCVMGFIVSG